MDRRCEQKNAPKQEGESQSLARGQRAYLSSRALCAAARCPRRVCSLARTCSPPMVETDSEISPPLEALVAPYGLSCRNAASVDDSWFGTISVMASTANKRPENTEPKQFADCQEPDHASSLVHVYVHVHVCVLGGHGRASAAQMGLANTANKPRKRNGPRSQVLPPVNCARGGRWHNIGAACAAARRVSSPWSVTLAKSRIPANSCVHCEHHRCLARKNNSDPAHGCSPARFQQPVLFRAHPHALTHTRSSSALQVS